MATLNINPNSSRLKALKYAVDVNIDMLNDMAVDPMWLNPQQVRELAAMSDSDIRAEMSKNSTEVNDNIDKLVSLQFLQAELNEIE